MPSHGVQHKLGYRAPVHKGSGVKPVYLKVAGMGQWDT